MLTVLSNYAILYVRFILFRDFVHPLPSSFDCIIEFRSPICSRDHFPLLTNRTGHIFFFLNPEINCRNCYFSISFAIPFLVLHGALHRFKRKFTRTMVSGGGRNEDAAKRNRKNTLNRNDFRQCEKSERTMR